MGRYRVFFSELLAGAKLGLCAVTAIGLSSCSGASVPTTQAISGTQQNPSETSVGTITACYLSAECTYTSAVMPSSYGPVDGPAFEFSNTGTQPITGARFTIKKQVTSDYSIPKDTFKIGTIDAGQSVVVIPGVSNDKKSRPGNDYFFYYLGQPRDTSEEFAGTPGSNGIIFVFDGTVGGVAAATGKIRVGATEGPSKDGNVSEINFLGGPNNADQGCSDCFAPKIIATIKTSGSRLDASLDSP